LLTVLGIYFCWCRPVFEQVNQKQAQHAAYKEECTIYTANKWQRFQSVQLCTVNNIITTINTIPTL
jgi:hypothetical protein